MEKIKDVTIIIRSVGERTEKLCKELILEQGIPENNLFVVNEIPFSKAMKVGYSLGIDQGLPWTYIIDADVLLRPGAISDMLNYAEKMPDNTLGVSGELLDKLWGKKRTAGNHLFRTKFLNRMIESILPYEREDIRPESDVIKKLTESGLEFRKNVLFIGLHDFEQHFRDIARKAFTHSKKHPQYLSEFFSFWLQASKKDIDYKTALFGISRGITHEDEVKINIDDFEKLYSDVDLKFGKKKEDISDFYIQTGKQVLTAMNNSDNYFKADNLLNERFEKIFRTKFHEKNYSTLLKNFSGKVLSNIGLIGKSE